MNPSHHVTLESLDVGQQQQQQQQQEGVEVGDDERNGGRSSLQHIAELMQARLEGRITNEQVERAVSAFLSSHEPVIATGMKRKVSSPLPADPLNSANSNTSSTLAPNSTSNTTPTIEVNNRSISPYHDNNALNSTTIQNGLLLLDTENYDDEDEDNDDKDREDEDKKAGYEQEPESGDEKGTIMMSLKKTKKATAPTSTPGTTASCRKRKKPTTLSTRSASISTIPQMDWTLYEDIPLGKQGAQMMFTFGDGPTPNPKAVLATLLGTRRMIQIAIQDARHVRRQQKRIYQDVVQSHKKHKPQKPQYSNEWSTELIYRAYMGKDDLSYNPKCGFTIEDLHQLFPEEMNAYSRWDAMHAEYAEQQEQQQLQQQQQQEQQQQQQNNNADTTTVDSTDQDGKIAAVDSIGGSHHATDSNDDFPTTDAVVVGGYLHERAAQFDVRTDRMKREWYMTFADVRQGSFINRRLGSSKASIDMEERQWESQRTQRNRGGQEQGVWGHMSASVVRFLHWIGFDPNSLLPPPNEATVHALGYLAYSFFGRVVEKAIELRNREKFIQQKKQQQQQQERSNNPISSIDLDLDEIVVVRELEHGEQLQETDIEQAMCHPDIKPVPLFSSSSSISSNNNNQELKPQLYFGPGFEDRLELELEQLIPMLSTTVTATTQGNTNDDDDDIQAQRQDEEIFTKLAEPPRTEAFSDMLLDRQLERPNITSGGNKNKSSNKKKGGQQGGGGRKEY